MIQREIKIGIQIPDDEQALGIYTSSYDAGRCGDSGVTKLVFDRPEEFATNNLRLIFESGYADPISIDLGHGNSFMLTSAQTRFNSFKMQVQFIDGNGNIAASNKLEFYLTGFSDCKGHHKTSAEFTQEILNSGISNHSIPMQIITEVDDEDPYRLIHKLIGFNHFGEKIVDLLIPEAELYYKKNFGRWMRCKTETSDIISLSFDYPISCIDNSCLAVIDKNNTIISEPILIGTAVSTYDLDLTELELEDKLSDYSIALFQAETFQIGDVNPDVPMPFSAEGNTDVTDPADTTPTDTETPGTPTEDPEIPTGEPTPAEPEFDFETATELFRIKLNKNCNLSDSLSIGSLEYIKGGI